MHATPRYTIYMKTKAYALLKTAALFLALGLGMVATAHAQWGWTDKDGRRIFSDQAPSSEVSDKSIFKRPAGSRAAAPVKAETTDTAAEPAAAGAAANAAAAAGAKPALKVSGKDPELEKKKKEAEAAETAKKKAEADKIASQKAENCELAKRSKTGLASGTRIATVNAKGEREIMSDTDRAVEIKRMDDMIASSCK
jgi:Domain of unknown function (DUF4124)